MVTSETAVQTALPRVGGNSNPDSPTGRRWARLRLLRASGMLPALVLVIIVGHLVSPAFLTAQNFETVLKITSVVGLISVGQTLIILSGAGGIDLSVGSVVAASGVCGALFAGYGMGGFVAGSLVAGAYFGLVNGLGVTRGRLQPFIVTLATMTIARGVAFYLSGGTPLVVNLPGLSHIGSASLWFIPIPVAVFLLVVVLAHVYLRYTVWGRELYAIGGTEEAAYLSGIPVGRRRLYLYVVSGLLAGLAAVLLTSFTASADANAANGYELNAIAAVVVGGTALSGGVGSVIGTTIGVLIIAFTGNILNLANVDPFMQFIINGLIVLAAVSLEARGKGGAGGLLKRLTGLGAMYAAIIVGALVMFFLLRPQ
ncbi:ABC transporter permease [Planosporangium flavigriseum]|uniref:Sugar transporter permease n=1 Tax=Planosporangium flavigriseum TaxID=373681 RepID=A0A8J3PR66_9ACTN|nr:ABC transporter permease [Planosporangium flavigriseum]NJC65503.1 ABC transporter permease [Planosporangium flavigriseum]GIG76811.1 sugar transporter permease [Planosporangium flavigriseum]